MGVPVLSDDFFTHQAPPRELFDKWKDQFPWSPSLLPIYEWENLLFIGCVEEPVAGPSGVMVVFVKVSKKHLEDLWNFWGANTQSQIRIQQIKTQQIPVTPPPPAQIPLSLPGANVNPPSTPPPLTGLHAPPRKPVQTAVAKQESIPESSINLDIDPKLLNQAFGAGADSAREADPFAGMADAAAHAEGSPQAGGNIVDDNFIELNPDSPKQGPPKPPPSIGNILVRNQTPLPTPGDVPSSQVIAEHQPIESDQQALVAEKIKEDALDSSEIDTPVSVVMSKEQMQAPKAPVAPPPPPPIQQQQVKSSPAGAQPSPSAGAKDPDPWADKMLISMDSNYSKSMILYYKDQQLKPWKARGFSEKIDKQFQVNLEALSPFRIVFKTLRPYHGPPPENEVLKSFLMHFNQGQAPEVLTLVPLSENEELFGILLGFGKAQANTRVTLIGAEKLAHEITSVLKAKRALAS